MSQPSQESVALAQAVFDRRERNHSEVVSISGSDDVFVVSVNRIPKKYGEPLIKGILRETTIVAMAPGTQCPTCRGSGRL